jgi:hypothetical protein
MKASDKRELRILAAIAIPTAALAMWLANAPEAEGSPSPGQICTATVDEAGQVWLNDCSWVDPVCQEDEWCWDPATMGDHRGSLPPGQVPIPGNYDAVDDA